MSDGELEKLGKAVGETANKIGLSRAVEHVAKSCGVPDPLGKTLGQATSRLYKHVPDEVKIGAGAGGLLAVHAAAHMTAMGTVGTMATGAATIAAAPVVIAGGVILGLGAFLYRVCNK